MSRYIDADKLIAHLKDEIEECCELPYGGRVNGKSIAYGTVLGLKSAISFAETLSTTDVVPKSEWISVDEGLPDNRKFIIACDKYGNVGEAYYRASRFEWVDDEEMVEATHWIPLPEAPKMKGE